MKLLPILALLAPIAALAATDYQNSLACAAKNPSTNAAISAFCNIYSPSGQFANNMVIPSSSTTTGKAVNGVRVKITGTCNPKQWVPVEYCGPQFHAICAEGGKANGFGKKRYGRNGCQTWSIGRDTVADRVGGIVAGLGGGH